MSIGKPLEKGDKALAKGTPLEKGNKALAKATPLEKGNKALAKGQYESKCQELKDRLMKSLKKGKLGPRLETGTSLEKGAAASSSNAAPLEKGASSSCMDARKLQVCILCRSSEAVHQRLRSLRLLPALAKGCSAKPLKKGMALTWQPLKKGRCLAPILAKG